MTLFSIGTLINTCSCLRVRIHMRYNRKTDMQICKNALEKEPKLETYNLSIQENCSWFTGMPVHLLKLTVSVILCTTYIILKTVRLFRKKRDE